jgi:hypothetical protein
MERLIVAELLEPILVTILGMRSITVTISILDIIHCPILYLKHHVSDTGFCLRLFRWNLLRWAI